MEVLEDIERESQRWTLDTSWKNPSLHQLVDWLGSADTLTESDFGVMDSIAISDNKTGGSGISTGIVSVPKRYGMSKL